jgi:hypothetical protein
MIKGASEFDPALQAEIYTSFGLNEIQANYDTDNQSTDHLAQFSGDTLHAYPFTTENMTDYIAELDLQDAEVAAICGSNDFAINAFKRGAKSVDSVDAMPTALLYGELKLAGLAEFDYDEFLEFFNSPSDAAYLDPEQYQRLRQNVSWQSSHFFDQLLTRESGTQFENGRFFIDKIKRPDLYVAMNPYLRNTVSYRDAQSKIGKTRFIPTDFCSFLAHTPHESYDAVYTSNIFAYMDAYNRDEVMRQAVRCLRIGGSILNFSFVYPDPDFDVVAIATEQQAEQAEKFGLEHTSIIGTVPHMDRQEPGDSGYRSLVSVMKKAA